jgi:hypothetical protein
MSAQAWVGIPRKKRGATRVVICEEVFDYVRGSDQIAVLHPLSNIAFACPAPEMTTEGATMQEILQKRELALKKAIWKRFTELRQASKQTVKL